jgi:hypothetical protein
MKRLCYLESVGAMLYTVSFQSDFFILWVTLFLTFQCPFLLRVSLQLLASVKASELLLPLHFSRLKAALVITETFFFF